MTANAIQATPEKPRTNSVAPILKATLIGGTLDILIALLQYYFKTGKSPVAVLKFIASGVFDKAAFTGGNEIAALGLVFHFIIVLIWAIIFYLLYPTFKALVGNDILIGILYALVIWAVMNMIVLPLSYTPPLPFQLHGAIIASIILIIAIGIPFSFIMKRHFKK